MFCTHVTSTHLADFIVYTYTHICNSAFNASQMTRHIAVPDSHFGVHMLHEPSLI